MNYYNFSNKTILVTGASSGIGRTVAIRLGELGAKVCLSARNIDRLHETQSLIKGDSTIYAYDVDSIDNIQDYVKSVTKHEGKLDGLVYCTGIDDTRPYKIMTPDVVERIMRTNFFAFYEMVRQFAKRQNCNDGARIVAISSVAGENPDKGQAIYGASKAAMDTAIIALSKELRPRNININSIRPAFVRTPLAQRMFDDETKYNIEIQPMGLIEPEDVAELVVYLMCDASRMISGRAIDIDGGGIYG